MKIVIAESAKRLGAAAAAEAAAYLREVLAQKGYARIVLSTGASQLDTIEALIAQDLDWSKIEMFHLDEYVGLPITHIASFRKYLQERFVSKVPLMGAYFVDGTAGNITFLTEKLLEREVDLGLIGIGENGHIAFNDPPADFDTKEAYIFVNLNDTCKRQQVGEGWFPTLDDVPKQAVSMTCYRIMQCKKIISSVPYAVKAEAVYQTLNNPLINTVPATLLKQHADWSLYLDRDSASKIAKF
ncbi:MAG: 6-phosphogluconolactonase [Oscillospiraceae bacterium]|jgi:glucosamine-6-phosphate deaminase|nr:6-phosphogluconolactonase [Oscillospiraceae bacterium]